MNIYQLNPNGTVYSSFNKAYKALSLISHCVVPTSPKQVGNDTTKYLYPIKEHLDKSFIGDIKQAPKILTYPCGNTIITYKVH